MSGACCRRFATSDELGRTLAERIVTGLDGAHEAARRYVLGLPAGRTARPALRVLVELLGRRGRPPISLEVVLMDEYAATATDGYRCVGPQVHYSCRGFVRRELQDPLAAAGAALADGQVHVPDARDPAAYEDEVAALGGIDLFVLASGASDGHVAFNPPGTPPDARTRVVELADATRRDNLATFPAFRELAEVPRHGVSVGPGSIVAASRSAVLVLTGAAKRTAVERIGGAEAYDPAWPATVVHACAGAEVWADAAAMALMSTPDAPRKFC